MKTKRVLTFLSAIRKPPDDLIIWATICETGVSFSNDFAREIAATHVVDQTMLIPDVELLELGLIVPLQPRAHQQSRRYFAPVRDSLLVDRLEFVLPHTVVALQDGILGR